MEFTNVKLEVANRVAYISIDVPPANTLSSATLSGLSDAFHYAGNNEEIKVVVVTGAGKFFVAGADIKEFTGAFDNPEKAEQMARTGQRLFDRIENFQKPVIAAINGAALGGGLELAMACHMRFAAEDAKLGLPELNLGLIPGFGGTQRLARLTNKAKALELILTSQFIDGKEAERIGLVNRAVPLASLMDEVKKFAEFIALQKSAISIRAALTAVTYGLCTGPESGMEKEAKLFGELFVSDDMKEGVNAFIEKRKAQFTDK
ncbi:MULTISPECIES: enoyl-CoA hydratase [Aneurinibacillus]|uniref:Enoyl-CoA hydratase n=1 Tax=Aneurinibacillus thermoaerophilus TaxID=143495 RepID=A0A1G8EH95_ANETH|nr:MULTISPECIES: enoyl-CoA hydratase [Aneurinibacillus]AMA72047.1 enoyl-CoA hydratase [Aneurinibacillus sp. XH2]MED0681407.1 enoyl-CoA hydratase [Aneurinibacillus thermoaerophilus]MED0736387.1 enoyl-CoA hydratase [Aneurinibacillus thermoaerophilus]MED0755881.1 enoyl-CoA hydratase [Aneurinibacillus thermoaerophilus]MED0759795.1 enoyl-CoA hydratase [Aneurinibacillus thermoaerophilus]